jgi:hypothetical protein
MSGALNTIRQICVVATIALSFVPALAVAGESCDIFFDATDQFSFGQAPIGSKLENVFPRDKPLTCFGGAKSNENDECYYTGDDGVSYTAFGYEIVDKTIEDLQHFKGRLIAGVAWGDSLTEVIRKLRYLPDGFPDWSIGYHDRGVFLFTGPCLKSSNGALWRYSLGFNQEGKLDSATAFLKGYEAQN